MLVSEILQGRQFSAESWETHLLTDPVRGIAVNRRMSGMYEYGYCTFDGSL